MIGIDIVEVERIKNLKKETIKFLFTNYEIEKSESLKNKYQFLAGRFAAKEAYKKAINIDAKFIDIEILNYENGLPYLKYKNKIENISLSISHEKNYAVAIVMKGRNVIN